MNISTAIQSTVQFLNQPVVKEGVKNVASSVTFMFGLTEAYDIYQIIRGRQVSTEASSYTSKWAQTACKIVMLSAKISLVLSAGVSRPGVLIISTLVGSMFSTAQLERAFGPNTIFAVNPWHPRHVVSIAATVLALPSILQSTLNGLSSIYGRIRHSSPSSVVPQNVNAWLTDAKVRLIALFNTITSRPTLHLGNIALAGL